MAQAGDILIAVMGVTGAGKSTFINDATGQTIMKVGTGLRSCTQKVEVHRCQVAGKWVTLIDTPGFDDTDLSDTDILELIAQFLATTYLKRLFLSGIILLQPINTNRVQGTEKRRTRLFEKVCGPNVSPNIVIGTTMWSEMSSQAEGDRRTQERVADKTFWGAMVGQGARVEKHNDGPQSARRIIQMVVDKKAIALQMQLELVAKDGKVVDTSAGKQLDADLGQDSAKVQRKIEDLRNERNAADEIRELRARLQQVEAERQRLRSSKTSWSLLTPAWLATLITGAGVAVASPASCTIL